MSRRTFLRVFAAMGLLSRSLQADDPTPEPPLPDALRIMKQTFARPLPSRFTAKSKLSLPGGVVTGQYEYHGSPQRCVLRGSLLSVGRFQGAPLTVHARRLVLHGGTWIDEKLGVDPELPNEHDTLVIDTFRGQREEGPQSPPRSNIVAARSQTFEPRSSLAGIGIAFGYRHQTVFPDLWASHPDETITVQREREQIDDAETIVVQFVSGAQRRTLWLDPRQGMLPRQIEVVTAELDRQPFGGAHWFTQSFCDDLPYGRRAFYHSFRFLTVGGQPWITGYRADFESDDQEGNACLLKGDYDLGNLQVDAAPPTEEELDAAVDIPAGSRVEVHLPEGEGRRVGLWQDGRVRPGGAGGVGGGGFF